MARTDNLKNYLTDIADAIREKEESTDKIPANEFDTRIKNLGGASEQWEWALNNVINFNKNNVTCFRNNTYLKVFPNYFNEQTKTFTSFANAFEGCSNLISVDLDTSNANNFASIFSKCTNIRSVNINTSNGTDFSYFVYRCGNLEEINIDTSKGTNFLNAFRECPKLTDEALKNIDLSNATNINYIVHSDPLITKILNTNYDNVINASGAYYNTGLTTIEDFELPNATTISIGYEGLFESCVKLVSVGNLKFPKATSLQNCFRGCSKLVNISSTIAPLCTNITNCFQNCTSLKTIGTLYTPKAFSMTMFSDCPNLESIDSFDVSAAVDMSRLFFAKNKIKKVGFQNTNKVINFNQLFKGCEILEEVTGLDLSSATNVDDIFNSCISLKKLSFVENSIPISINIGFSNLLTDESVQSIIDGLKTVDTQQTLTLHTDIVAKLTDEQKQTIESKNWIVESYLPPSVRTDLELDTANYLICTISGRKYTKTTNDLAIVSLINFGDLYTGPLLIGTTSDSVSFNSMGQTLISTKTFEYNGTTYYYSSREYFMGNNPTVVSDYSLLNNITGKTYTNDDVGSIEAGKDLLDYYFKKT